MNLFGPAAGAPMTLLIAGVYEGYGENKYSECSAASETGVIGTAALFVGEIVK